MKEAFNPEPWVRSLLWLALAVTLFVAVIYNRSPIKIEGGGIKVDVGQASVPAEQAPKPVPGGQSIKREGPGTTWVSECPPKTQAIGGICKLLSGGGALQNFGPERNDKGGSQFACVWQ